MSNRTTYYFGVEESGTKKLIQTEFSQIEG